MPGRNEREWDLGAEKMLLSIQSLISLYFHLSSPDNFLHAVAFLNNRKSRFPDFENLNVTNTFQLCFP